MKIFSLIFLFLIISSCKGDDKKSIEKKVFIVSRFNDDIEKHIKEAIIKNPELSTIKEISLYDYPKGAINFIIFNYNSVYYYNEELIWNWCGWGSDKIEPIKRRLSKDSLHPIQFKEIYPLLQSKSFDKNMKDHRGSLQHISFSFENDTLKNLDIYKLLQDVDTLGYHSYDVRKIAPFEIEAMNNKK